MNKLDQIAEEYAKKTVAEDCSMTGDWVNIAHDFKAGWNAREDLGKTYGLNKSEIAVEQAWEKNR